MSGLRKSSAGLRRGIIKIEQISGLSVALAAIEVQFADVAEGMDAINDRVDGAYAGIATKEPIINPGTIGQYLDGLKSWKDLNRAAVGLSNVDNTSDSDKPVSTAQAIAIGDKVGSAQLSAVGGAALVGTENFIGGIIPDNSNAQQALQALLDGLNETRANTVIVDYFGIGLAWDDDWAPSFAAASVAAGQGGIIYAPKRYTLKTEPYIQPGVTIRGPYTSPDEILPASAGDYDGRNGTIFLKVDGAGMVDGFNVNASCSWEGLTIMPTTLNLPFANAAAAAAGVAAFAGLAFNVAGPGATFRNLLILGFNKAIYSRGNERVRCEGVRMDCTNGIDIQLAYDIPRIKDCWFWPYTTVHQTWTTNTLLRRSGTAFNGKDVNDWMSWESCFSYGAAIGFHADTVNTVTFFLCGADNTSTSGVGDNPGSRGFLVDGICAEPRWTLCQAAAQSVGFDYNNAGGNHGTMAFCEAWAFSMAGTQIQQGNLAITGGVMRSSVAASGIVNQATGADNVNIVGMHFEALGIGINNASSASILRYHHCTFAGVGVHIANAYIPTLASAASIVPNGIDFDYLLTGTTNVGSISSPQRYVGRGAVSLTAVSSLTIAVGGNILLKDNVNFTMRAGDTLSVVSDGTNWHEVGRAQVNAWVSTFVPTISATTGSVTSSAASCQYKRDGATVHFSLAISVITNGTGDGTLRSTLPFSAAASCDTVFAGRDRGAGGKALTGTLIALGNVIDIKNYDNTYPASDGSFIVVSGTYQAA